MNSQAVSLRDAGLDASAPAHADWTRAGHTADPRRAPVEVRALSVLQDASALRWRYGERLNDVLDDACRRFADRTAVSTEGGDYTFSDLDARANQMARYFISEGVSAGDRVGVLLDRGFEAYAALFGLLKARATYVPLDANHPADRIDYILGDAGASHIVTQVGYADRFARSLIPSITLDRAREDIRLLDNSRLDEDDAAADDGLCYVLYTSGTSGHPKGVAVAHPSICNFVRVAAELYGFAPGDRVYQGMSMAFDFSIEELWVPLVAGATLVPNTAPESLFGDALADFLEARAVTCFCCVPTLLASIERDLPRLRIFLIGGEACPPALVARWAAPGRKLLNSYGPTETTVTATLGEMCADKPVTIGKPLPTYSIVILDAHHDEAVAMGETGEIGIAGIGVAEGYLNRQELTEAKFIADFLQLPNNPSGRIYRTGDLGRITSESEIEYLGRIDTQVKLRGYRIELGEIETVLLEIPEISQVAATVREVAPGARELVAYYALKHGVKAPEPRAIVALMRSRLPTYMTPAYLERLPFIPTLVSNKTDRERLPAPKSARLVLNERIVVPPTTETETVLCKALGETFGLAEVSIDGDFFKDYGAHSLLMARFCARARTLAPALNVAMRDVYASGNVRRLAAVLDAAAPIETIGASYGPQHIVSPLSYYGCGAMQLAYYLVAGGLYVLLAQSCIEWLDAALDSPALLLARGVAVAVGGFLCLNAIAIAAKWLLIGRARPATLPIWSVAYYKFWLAKQLIHAAPANLFAGTPVYNIFLRALGARIGRHAVIASVNVPVAADLLRVGDHAVVTKRAILKGYKAVGNRLYFGNIDIGRDAYVGEAAVLDIDTSIGDFGQIGHVSSLQSGQHIPAGKRYHGSPAEETTTNFRLAHEVVYSTRRRAMRSAVSLLGALVAGGACLAGGVALAGFGLGFETVAHSLTPLQTAIALLAPTLWLSLALYGATLALGLAAVAIIPRLANLFLRPGRIYPLYGFHYAMQRLVEVFGNAPFFNLLFGDSVLIERYLRLVGWKIGDGCATGSNFGTEQSQDNPFLCTLGAGAVASDGLQFVNVSLSSDAFRLGECVVGANSFFGTDVHFLAGARVGDNCMLATKAMAPIDGPMRENVGLLGSPAFEIPRAAARDLELVARISEDERRSRLRRKTRHNLVSMAILLASRWAVEFTTIYVFAFALAVFDGRSHVTILLATGAVVALDVGLLAFFDRASLGFGRMKPQIATVYDKRFWAVERYWKLAGARLETMFAGTPFSPLMMRLLGMRVGRMVFNDGCGVSERTLVEIGDGANLNAHSFLQAHSLEEGVFKCDVIRIGAGVSVGVNALVHYGVEMRAGSTLDADAFLMKGEVMQANSRWRGNPAKPIGGRAAAG